MNNQKFTSDKEKNTIIIVYLSLLFILAIIIYAFLVMNNVKVSKEILEIEKDTNLKITELNSYLSKGFIESFSVYNTSLSTEEIEKQFKKDLEEKKE